MRLLVVSLLVLFGAVALALVVRDDTGHIFIAYGDWTLETCLSLFIIALALTFMALYYSVRLWHGVRLLPHRLKRWRRRRRSAKVQMSYIRGMHALAEAQGSQVRRDSYLRAAAAHEPRAEVAVGLATAAYHLDYQRTAEAVAILDRLRSMQPKHPTVLKRLMEAYIAEQRWDALLALVPELEQRKVLQGGRLEDLQAKGYCALFTEPAPDKEAAQLRALWENAPRAIKRHEEVLYAYAGALSAADAQAADRLVYAYGLVAGGNIPTRLATAERWLKFHAANPVLLLTLGRLCIRGQLWGKGRSYLEASLGIDPQAETYRDLGALLERLNNKAEALECYRKALALVPGRFAPRTDDQPAPYRPLATDTPLLPAQGQ